jgi:hypothetical protein
MKPIDPDLFWSGLLLFLASPLIFLIGPVRRRRRLRIAAQVIVGPLYLIAFVLLCGLLLALNGTRG